MKIRLELNIPDDRTFLNFWDHEHGNDVTCQIIDGKLMKSQYDENSKELPPTEISLQEFIQAVKESVEKWPD